MRLDKKGYNLSRNRISKKIFPKQKENISKIELFQVNSSKKEYSGKNHDYNSYYSIYHIYK